MTVGIEGSVICDGNRGMMPGRGELAGVVVGDADVVVGEGEVVVGDADVVVGEGDVIVGDPDVVVVVVMVVVGDAGAVVVVVTEAGLGRPRLSSTMP